MKKFQTTKEVIKHCLQYVSGDVLDLGAGGAKYKPLIISRAKKYTALDMKPGKNIDVVGSAMNLPLPDDSFDTVICSQVLEHVERPWIVVKETRRVLRTNGICIFTAPFLIPNHADPNDYFRFTLQGFESLFKNEGFEIIKTDYYCQFFSTIAESIRFLFFNPYKYPNWSHSWLASRLVEYLARLTKFLDKITINDIIYGNVYMIAKKKKL